jgi:hypothetical protein
MLRSCRAQPGASATPGLRARTTIASLARLRTLRSDLIDPTIAVHHGRVVKRTGDGSIVEFRSVVDAVNCAVELQRAMVERNAEVAPDKRIEFRIGVSGNAALPSSTPLRSMVPPPMRRLSGGSGADPQPGGDRHQVWL